MRQSQRAPQSRRMCLAGILCMLTACAGLPMTPQPSQNVSVPVEASVPVAVKAAAAPPAPVPAIPAPAAKPAPEPVGPPQLSPRRVAVVLSNANPSYLGVARELISRLHDPIVYDLSDVESRSAFTDVDTTTAEVVVAIGLPAAKAAKAHVLLPVVFCQVFNYGDQALLSDRVSGVSAIPPLQLLLLDWKERSPELENIGAILGEGHDQLLDEAERAASTAGVNLHKRTTKSDRETLYLFNQLLPEIDGFWLFPDNRILSPSVLRQMLDYAARYDVQVMVFNDSLLELGASLSGSSVDSDIAETVLSVVEKMYDLGGEAEPNIVPLTEIQVQTGSDETAGASGDLASASDA